MPNRPASAWLPRSFRFWPEEDVDRSAHEIQRMYEAGFAGAWYNPEGVEEFESFIGSQPFGNTNGDQVIHAAGFADSGKDQLVIPFTFAMKLLPNCWPGAAQARGDCVSHSQKNADLLTMICDIVSGQPDEVTGRYEGLPEIAPEGITQGALSTEAIYWYRGYNGDGWECDVAAKVACTKAALWPRKNYPDLGIDLTRYSGSLAGKYGSKSPPSEITTFGQQHLIRTSTRLTSGEQVRDMLKNGYGVTTCGGEGWSSTRNEDGVSKRSGSWSHALAILGYDDRPIVKQKYNGPLWLIQNSWAKFNSGPRRILGTDIDIPEGSFWALEKDCLRRSALAMSGASGFPAKSLPAYLSLAG